MSGKTMRGISILAFVAILLVLVCVLPCQCAYAQEGSDSLTHVADTPEGTLVQEDGQITITGGKSDGYASHYLTNQTVSGNFVAEVDFCIISYSQWGAYYFGLTFYQNTDVNGHGYGYSANIQAKNDTSPTSLASFYYNNNTAKFIPKSPTNGTIGKAGTRATLRIAVNNGVVSTYIIVDDKVDIRNTYDLADVEIPASLREEGKTYLDSGKIGVLVDDSITVNIYDIAVYDYDNFFANEVDNLIVGLPVDITYADKTKIEKASEAYEALSAQQKELVKNYAKLELAEQGIIQIENDMVNNLIAKIDTLKTIDDVSTLGEQIDAIKQSYSDMDKDLKVRVTNYSLVAAQQARYENLKEVKRQADERIKKVVDAINALPQLNVLVEADKQTVFDAKALYDELSDEDKTQVGNIERLNNALNAFENAKSEPGNDSAQIAFIVLLSLAVATCIACIVLFALGNKNKKQSANKD